MSRGEFPQYCAILFPKMYCFQKGTIPKRYLTLPRKLDNMTRIYIKELSFYEVTMAYFLGSSILVITTGAGGVRVAFSECAC